VLTIDCIPSYCYYKLMTCHEPPPSITEYVFAFCYSLMTCHEPPPSITEYVFAFCYSLIFCHEPPSGGARQGSAGAADRAGEGGFVLASGAAGPKGASNGVDWWVEGGGFRFRV